MEDERRRRDNSSFFSVMICLFALTFSFLNVFKESMPFMVFVPTIVLSAILCGREINPLKWWRIFFGYEVRINLYLKGDNLYHQDFEEIEEWVKTRIPKNQYHKITDQKYRFFRKRHAAMFKLMWG